MNILLGYFYTFGYIIAIILLSNLFKKKEYSRKFIHIGVSFVYFIMFHYFKYSIHLIIPPLIMIIINFLSVKFNLIKSMERDNKSYGTVYYALSMFIMALITYFFNSFKTAYFVGMFTMALGDGFAPLIADGFKSKKIYKDKTLSGAITVFLFTAILILIALPKSNYIYIFLVSLFATYIELYSKKGLDNIFLPLGTSLLIYILFL